MPANRPLLKDYVSRFVNRVNSWRMTPAEAAIEERTRQLPADRTIDVLGTRQHAGVMGIPAAEANFLALLTRLLDGQPHKMKAIDIGTFTGRSALAIAQAMPHGGEVIACETDPHYAAVAEQCWAQAGPEIRDRITLKRGKAEDTLNDLIAKENAAGTFDLIFIDADKPGYPRYYEKALALLRPGGLVVLDNMLWSGRVAKKAFYANPSAPTYDDNARILRELNERVAKDPQVDAVLLSFEDGVMVAQKRETQRGEAVILSEEEHGAAEKRHDALLRHLRQSTKGIGR